jgi:hypothetical protein
MFDTQEYDFDLDSCFSGGSQEFMKSNWRVPVKNRSA